ncbi:MAG: PAS domain S-box protein [Desulfobacteraceae bacterium]|nr:MAG: PAS domain S-box protein [Desulfobacteraceae bacterium]
MEMMILEERKNRRADFKSITVDSAEFLQMVFDGVNDGLLATNRKGTIVVVNSILEKMLDHPRSEICGRVDLSEILLFGEMERLNNSLMSEECGGRNRSLFFETSLLTRSGRAIPVQMSAARSEEAVHDIGIVALIRNLKEMLRAEREEFDDPSRLLQQDKMMSLGRLSASVVHEINNPLAGILNYVRLMSKMVSRKALEEEHLEKFRKFLTMVESETERCSRIVSNLLAFSRKSGMEQGEISVNDLIERSVMLSRHKMEMQNIKVEIHAAMTRPTIQGDFNQLQQCLINLIFNAIDAMPEGGVLSIFSSRQEGMAEIKVQDTGCGIPQEVLPSIFDPFFTTKGEGKGLGLGLSTVQGIIRRHKGTIRVKSEPGKGTVFTIRFPLP